MANLNSQAGPGRVAKILSMDQEELRKFVPGYTLAFIKKRSGGKRVLHIPDANTKQLQRTLNRKLFSHYRLHPNCCGFVKGKSIVENAAPHIGQETVIKLDIVDFFPSTTASRVHKYFASTGWSGKAARLLTTLVCYENGLPQGAPTSPLLSNIVNKLMDHRLSGLAVARNAQYTRYADDLTFSLAVYDREIVHSLLKTVGLIVRDCGYRLNVRKKQILRAHRRQSVTGIVVNKKVNLPRTTRRWLRSVYHRMQTSGKPTLSSQEFNGWISLLRMINPSDPLVHQVSGTIPEANVVRTRETSDQRSGVLRSPGQIKFRPKKLGDPRTLDSLGIKPSTDALTPTQYFSCYLLKQKGYSVSQIARFRELTEKVVWKHLAVGVRESILSPTPLTSKEVLRRLYAIVKERYQGRPPRIAVLFRECSREIPYGEIRVALSYLARRKELSATRADNSRLMKLSERLSVNNSDAKFSASTASRSLTISFLIQSQSSTFSFELPESYAKGKTVEAVLDDSDVRLEIYIPAENNAEFESIKLPRKARAKVRVEGWSADSRAIVLRALEFSFAK